MAQNPKKINWQEWSLVGFGIKTLSFIIAILFSPKVAKRISESGMYKIIYTLMLLKIAISVYIIFQIAPALRELFSSTFVETKSELLGYILAATFVFLLYHLILQTIAVFKPRPNEPKAWWRKNRTWAKLTVLVWAVALTYAEYELTSQSFTDKQIKSSVTPKKDYSSDREANRLEALITSLSEEKAAAIKDKTAYIEEAKVAGVRMRTSENKNDKYLFFAAQKAARENAAKSDKKISALSQRIEEYNIQLADRFTILDSKEAAEDTRYKSEISRAEILGGVKALGLGIMIWVLTITIVILKNLKINVTLGSESDDQKMGNHTHKFSEGNDSKNAAIEGSEINEMLSGSISDSHSGAIELPTWLTGLGGAIASKFQPQKTEISNKDSEISNQKSEISFEISPEISNERAESIERAWANFLKKSPEIGYEFSKKYANLSPKHKLDLLHIASRDPKAPQQNAVANKIYLQGLASSAGAFLREFIALKKSANLNAAEKKSIIKFVKSKLPL